MTASEEQHISVLVDERVAMRDGVALATDVYLPHHVNAGPLPVILERTPYDKEGTSRGEVLPGQRESITRPAVARYFAARGYAVVMQDCRGRYRSEGEFRKYLDEANDGVDTLAWLLEQSWCDGRVATMGLSYGAHTQVALASLNPAGLACMFIDSGGFSNAFTSGVRQGGAFEMKQATWAYRHAILSPLTSSDADRRQQLEAVDIAEWLRKIRWTPGDSPFAAAPEFERYFFAQLSNTTFSDYWRQPGLFAEGYYDQFPDIPIAIVGSWYDPYVQTCIDNFNGLRGDRRHFVHLLMGPWTHGDRMDTFAGDVDFGSRAALHSSIAASYLDLRLRWFDQHLKPERQGAPAFKSPVTYFQMGGGPATKDHEGRLRHGGEWHTCDEWPPAGARPLTLYLSVDGTLQHSVPTCREGSHAFVFDPEDPVPTLGGGVTSGAPVMFGGAFDQVQLPETFAVRSVDKPLPLGARADVLVFQTPPLAEGLSISGPVIADLWVSSDRPDTDFTIKLLDVYPPSAEYPDGFAMNLTDGVFRMRYRKGWEREVTMQQNEVYRITVRAFDTSNYFASGHRLRVDVASSNYPRFDVNPNNGDLTGAAFKARNVVHSNARYPSCIRLLAMDSSAEDCVPEAQKKRPARFGPAV